MDHRNWTKNLLSKAGSSNTSDVNIKKLNLENYLKDDLLSVKYQSDSQALIYQFKMDTDTELKY